MSSVDVLINGKQTDQILSDDRGLLYGDGLFETIKILDGELVFWERHLARLLGGCDRLKMRHPDIKLLYNEASALSKGVDKGIIKIIYTRGCGGRGYRFDEKNETNRIVQRHAWPEYPQSYKTTGVSVRLCETRLGHNASLAGLKHLNRLEQVLARSEWQDDDNTVEGLMADEQGNIIEGTMSNLFYVTNDTLMTPDLDKCGVMGIMRQRVIDYANQENLKCAEKNVSYEDLQNADEIFMTNSIISIWPVKAFDEREYQVGPVTKKISRYIETSRHANAANAGSAD